MEELVRILLGLDIPLWAKILVAVLGSVAGVLHTHYTKKKETEKSVEKSKKSDKSNLVLAILVCGFMWGCDDAPPSPPTPPTQPTKQQTQTTPPQSPTKKEEDCCSGTVRGD